MDSIRKALRAYRIEAVKIDQVTGRTFCVNDGKNVYALKKSRLTSETISNWQNVYHQAYSQNLSGVLSVFLTEQGGLYQEVDGVIYYITPWLESKNVEQKQKIERVFRTIGIIHAKTKRSVTNDVQKVRSQFKNYREYCMNLKSSLLGYVEKFEKNRYMSPFELLVCTHYRDLDILSARLNDRLEQFIDELDEQTDWNYSLCHGQLVSSHVLHGHQTFITNWEKAQFNNAVIDLSIFLKDLVTYYDQPTEQLIDSFSIYTDENSLSNSELYLLSIYLMDPGTYINIVKRYTNNPSNRSMVHQIVELQHVYRQLSSAMKWSEHIDQITVLPYDESES